MNDPLTGRTSAGAAFDNPITLSSTPALSQAIAPNWTDRHNWTIATAAGFTNAGEYSLRLNTGSVATAINTDYPSPFLTFKNSYWDGAAAAYDLGIIGLTNSIGSSTSGLVMAMDSSPGMFTLEKDGKMFWIQGSFGATTSFYNFGGASSSANGEADLLRLMNTYVGTTDGVSASALFDVRNDANIQKTIGKLKFTCDDVSDTTEDSSFSVWTQVAGTLTKVWEVSGVNTLSSLSIAQGTITDPANALSITGTWDDAADTFVGVLWNFTSTNSAAASQICDFQLGGVSRWSLRKDGIIVHTGSGGSTFTVNPDTAGINHSVGYLTSTNTIRLTTGTKTASDPVIDATQTWNNAGVTFTALKVNVTDTASASASLLMDLQQSSTSRFFALNIGGATTVTTLGVENGLGVRLTVDTAVKTMLGVSSTGVGQISIGSGSGGRDTFLQREAPATFQLGQDAATATAQKLKAHDGSGTDKDGANFTLAGGQPTGTGRGGALITQTGLTSTTGSTAGSYTNRSFASAKQVTLTETTATTFCNVAVPSGKHAGFTLVGTVFASDGTDHQSITSQIRVDAVNKAGTVTPTITQTDNTTAASAGTLTCTYTAVANGNTVDIKADATSSLSQTVLAIRWAIVAMQSDDVATVTAS